MMKKGFFTAAAFLAVWLVVIVYLSNVEEKAEESISNKCANNELSICSEKASIEEYIMQNQ